VPIPKTTRNIMNKRWHFKFVHAGKMGAMWSERSTEGSDRMLRLKECLNQLRAVHGLSNHEILDASCQYGDDPSIQLIPATTNSSGSSGERLAKAVSQRHRNEEVVHPASYPHYMFKPDSSRTGGRQQGALRISGRFAPHMRRPKKAATVLHPGRSEI